MSLYQYIQTHSEKIGFHGNVIFIAKPTNTKSNKKKTRKYMILWFNPPFCRSVKTNVGRIFLKLIKKYFSEGSSLTKIVNINTVKVSYSCMGTFHPSYGHRIRIF